MEEKVTRKRKKDEDVLVEAETNVSKTIERKPKRTVNDLQLNERVSIDNLTSWEIGVKSEETNRSFQIKPYVKDYKMLSLAEVDSQVKIGNVAFIGRDGMGSHAAIRINDPVVREYVFGEDISPIQLTEENVADLFNSLNKREFDKKLSELVVTDSEKRMIANICFNPQNYPTISIDTAPSYMVAAIERLTGVEIKQ